MITPAFYLIAFTACCIERWTPAEHGGLAGRQKESPEFGEAEEAEICGTD